MDGSIRTAAISPVRQRVIAFLERSPDAATVDDLPKQPRCSSPCPCCGGHMIIIETFARWSQPRAPPHRPHPTERFPS